MTGTSCLASQMLPNYRIGLVFHLSMLVRLSLESDFRGQIEQDLRGYHKTGLKLQIGMELKAQEDTVNIPVNKAGDQIHLDPSEENYHRQVRHVETYINSLKADPKTKLEWCKKAFKQGIRYR